MGKSKSTGRKAVNPFIVIIAVMGFVIALMGASSLGWLTPPDPASITPGDGDPDATTFTFEAQDYVSEEALADVDKYDNPSALINVYDMDVSEMTAQQIEDATFASFADKSSGVADNVEITIEDDHFYIANISVAGFSEVWLHYTDMTSLFVAGMQTMVRGLNEVSLVNVSATASMAAIGTNTDGWLNVTVENTTYRNWEVMFAFETSDEGVAPEWDQLNDYWTYFCINITTNETAAVSSWIGTPTSEVNTVEKLASGDSIYMFWDLTLIDDGAFNIKAVSSLNTDFEIVSISIGYGSPDAVADITTFATQV